MTNNGGVRANSCVGYGIQGGRAALPTPQNLHRLLQNLHTWGNLKGIISL